MSHGTPSSAASSASISRRASTTGSRCGSRQLGRRPRADSFRPPPPTARAWQRRAPRRKTLPIRFSTCTPTLRRAFCIRHSAAMCRSTRSRRGRFARPTIGGSVHRPSEAISVSAMPSLAWVRDEPYVDASRTAIFCVDPFFRIVLVNEERRRPSGRRLRDAIHRGRGEIR